MHILSYWAHVFASLWPLNVVIAIVAAYYAAVAASQFHDRARAGLLHVHRMDGEELGRHVRLLFGRMGYTIEQLASAYPGPALVAVRMGTRTAVLVRRQRGRVGVAAVGDAVTAMQRNRCDRGVLVAPRGSTPAAQVLGRANRVEIWDSHGLALQTLAAQRHEGGG